MAQFDATRRTFVRGAGTMLVDSRGRRTFDAVSSIWTTIHGHGHPAIVERIARQAERLDHATLLGATNDVAEELAARLAVLSGLGHVFFSSDGASAIEVALKMAVQYWQNVGQPQRTRFIRLVDSYHGDTVAAMSVSDIAIFKARFGALTFTSLPYGETRAELDAPDVAAIIIEPTVQAAAGMRIVSDDVYAGFASRSTLLIVDEIATGFGRTGTMFACERLGLMPDILCLGKGLTGGTLALSATLATDRIYDAFLGEHAELRHFFHGHSYAGNPIACAAALASLDLFERESTLARTGERARELAPALAKLGEHPRVRMVRQAGLMCGIELDATGIDAREALTPAWRVAEELYDRGFFTRPIGDVIQLVPPLSSTRAELNAFCSALGEILDA